MDYKLLFEQTNNEILSNKSISGNYLEHLHNKGEFEDPSYINAFRRLFLFLDKRSNGRSLNIKIDIDDKNRCFIVHHDNGPLSVEDCLAFYIIDGSDGFPSWTRNQFGSEENNTDKVYISQEDAKRESIELLQSLTSVFYRIEFPCEDLNTYALDKRQWGETEHTPWPFMLIGENNLQRPSDALILYPEVMAKAKRALKDYPKNDFIFLETSDISLKSEYLELSCYYDSYKQNDDDKFLVRILQPSYSRHYWLVLGSEELIIQDLNRRAFELDENCPSFLSRTPLVNVSFAINIERGYSSYSLSIPNIVEGMSIISSEDRYGRFLFPFWCNAHFVYADGQYGKILFQSAYNKWILSQIPSMYFKQLQNLPKCLLKDYNFEKIIPTPLTFQTIPELPALINDAILNSRVRFIPDIANNAVLSISECFYNNTSIRSFDDLVSSFLEKKYAVFTTKELNGTSFCKDLLRYKFNLSDAIALLTQGESIKELSPERYVLFLFELFDSFVDATVDFDNCYVKEIALLANCPILISADGQFLEPRRIVINERFIHVNEYAPLHEAFLPYLNKTREHHSITFGEFLNALGVHKIIEAEVSGQPLSFLSEGYKKTIQFTNDLKTVTNVFPDVQMRQDGGYYLKDKDCLTNEIPNNPALKEVAFRIGVYTYRGVIDNKGKILFPFGYDRETKCFLENGGVFMYGNSECYRQAYSIDGKELFPGDDSDRYGLGICFYLSDGRFILSDARERFSFKYSFLNKDLSITPFDEAFYKESSNMNYSFREFGDSFIVADGYYGETHEFAVIDKQGKVVLSRREGYVYYCQQNGSFVIKCNYGEGWYACDSNGNYLFDLKKNPGFIASYEDEVDIASFQDPNGMIRVSRRYQADPVGKEYFGLVDASFRVVLPLTCEKVLRFPTENSLYCIVINGQYGVFSSSNGIIIIPAICDYVRCIGGRYFSIVTGCSKEKDERTGKITIIGGTQRLVSLDGKKLPIPQCFESLSVKDNHIIARLKLSEDTRVKCGVYDMDLNEIIPIEYDYIISANSYYKVNNGGDVIRQNNGVNLVSGGKWGVYMDGERVIECIYNSIREIGPMNEPLFRVELDGKFGLIDATGKVVVPIEYDAVYPPVRGIARVFKKGKDPLVYLLGAGDSWLFYDVDKSAEISPALEYKYVGNLINGYAVFQKGDKFGYLNEKYEVAINSIFDEAYDFSSEGTARVVLDKAHIVIDKYSNQVGEWKQTVSPSYNREDDYYSYSPQELEEMRRGAYENVSEAEWNTD